MSAPERSTMAGDKSGWVSGPRMQGGTLNRIDFSFWPFGQRVKLGDALAAGAVVAAVSTAVGVATGAVVLTFPASN